MFTGIVEAVGSVAAVEAGSIDTHLTINPGTLPTEDVYIGDSVCVSGCCLTVVAIELGRLAFDVSRESLECTTLGQLRPGSRVNLERALSLQSRLGGHLVSGHVDGVGEVLERALEGRSWRLRLRCPEPLSRYVAEKGSICLDGTSLTVNRVQGAEFEVQIIPHTHDSTIVGDYGPGTRVNLEVDLVARYVERLLAGRGEPAAPAG